MVPSSPSLPVLPRCISASCWHNVIFIRRSTFASPLSPPPPFPDCFCNFPLSAIHPLSRYRQRSAAGAGFPLINAVADMFKGHINTGLARWAIASLLTLATCVGVVMALTIWGYADGCDRISVSVGAGYDPPPFLRSALRWCSTFPFGRYAGVRCLARLVMVHE